MDEKKLLKRKQKAQMVNNNRLVISICTELADLYMKTSQFQEAIEEFQTLANIYKAEKNQIEYAKANRAIGEAYLGLNNYEKALEHQKLYLNIATAEKNDIEIQRAYANIGHVFLTTYLETQKHPETNLNAAYKYLMKSMRLSESLSGVNKLEKADMQARLLSNLGLVKESLGDYNKALELLTTSINLCKSNDIYEQLYRGYMSMAALYDKVKDSAKTMHHYNLAIDAAKNLNGNLDLLCGALLAKAQALINLGDFHTSKKTLYKAYKLKSPNKAEREIIERYLKTVVKMCRTEDRLVIETNDSKKLKKLYEELGDCACHLKNYSKALEYYKLMLTYAEKSGVSGRELSSCYYSLAETYRDNNMYAEAVDFFEKEYLLCTELKDNLNTLSNIADVKEAGDYSVSDVKAVYDRALENCRKHKNLKEERRMITRCILYLRRVNEESDAQKLKEKLKALPKPSRDESSSSDSDKSDSNEDKENDIDLSKLTDMSDDSDIDQNPEAETSAPMGKRRSKVFTIKKNAKGESQLHVACINGKIPVVKHLLEQGHPVNVRDNTGWLPIHEACNHGYYEIVRLLLDKGASINDRGGSKCQGVTPVYDAANNGHINIVELLMERGASVTIKTDNGDTPLNVLKLYHKKYPFTCDDFNLYQKLVVAMTAAMKKVGDNVTEQIVERHMDEEEEEEEENVVDDLLSDDSEKESPASFPTQPSRNDEPDLLNEYQQIMKNLSKKSSNEVTKQPERKQIPRSRSALVIEDNIIDDWLEDDFQTSKTTKKRKTGSFDSVITSLGKNSPSPQKRLSDRNIGLINEDINVKSIPATAKRKFQTTLLESGFNSGSSSGKKRTPSIQRRHSSQNVAKQPKITSFSKNKSSTDVHVAAAPPVQPMASTQPVRQIQPTTQPVQYQESVAIIPVARDFTVYVDVKIEDKVFRVPHLLSEIQTLTIGWLADQAATKYARKECFKPTLEIVTASGVQLFNDDPLSVLFPLGNPPAEMVIGRNTDLYKTALVNRYKEACSNMNKTVDEALTRILEEVSVTLNIEHRGFTNNVLFPLCKALNHETTLTDINLSGNFIDSSSMTILCSSLPSLINLSSLSLKCTGLSSSHLAELVKMFSTSTGRILEKLKRLDLSNNYLRNKSFAYLAELTNFLSLESLNIANVDFNKNLFKEDRNGSLKLVLKNVTHLNISNHHLSTEDVEKFISWTTVGELVELNISRNSFSNFGLDNVRELREDMFASLRCLNLSRTGLMDSDLLKLLRLCTRSPLTKLDLSYNSELTGLSLRRLINISTIQELSLIGCFRVLEYFPEDSTEVLEGCEIKLLKITADFNTYDAQINSLTNYFKRLYREPLIEKGKSLLKLYSERPDT